MFGCISVPAFYRVPHSDAVYLAASLSPWQTTTTAAAATDVAASTQHSGGRLVPVTVSVADLSLGFGEQLRLAGESAELGSWQSSAAPLLEYRPDGRWTATLALPPGRHTCKLVRVQEGGGMQWEDGEDRVLGVPATAAAVSASLRFGDTAATDVTVQRGPLPAAPPGAQPAAPKRAEAAAWRAAAAAPPAAARPAPPATARAAPPRARAEAPPAPPGKPQTPADDAARLMALCERTRRLSAQMGEIEADVEER